MSEFKILEYRERADSLWGLENKEITELELEALLEGKRLWTNINEEYAMTIRLKDRLNELNIDREKRELQNQLQQLKKQKADEIKQLQSKWNSLREWLENEESNGSYSISFRDSFRNVLSKMNELESGDEDEK